MVFTIFGCLFVKKSKIIWSVQVQRAQRHYCMCKEIFLAVHSLQVWEHFPFLNLCFPNCHHCSHNLYKVLIYSTCTFLQKLHCMEKNNTFTCRRRGKKSQLLKLWHGIYEFDDRAVRSGHNNEKSFVFF